MLLLPVGPRRLVNCRAIATVVLLWSIAAGAARAQPGVSPTFSLPQPLPTSVATPIPAQIENPLQVPPQPLEAMWQQVVDIIDDSYPIERNAPPATSYNQNTPGVLQSFALILPPPPSVMAPQKRRWVGITARPNERGCSIEVFVAIEVQDTLRGVEPDAAAWRQQGRDFAEEQRILQLLVTRLGRTAGAPSALPDLEPIEPLTELSPRRERAKGIWNGIRADYRNFYSFPSLAGLTAAFGVGGALANTAADQEILQAYNERIGYQSWLHNDFQVFGRGQYAIPALGGIFLTGLIFHDRPFLGGPFEEYGERGIRALLVGGPPMLLMQRVTGASRPDENPWGSDWRFWRDSNGVSGDAFIGGVVFMSAAKMTDRPLLKAGLYTLSAFPAIGRVNDNAHYPSQALLGWCMALAAVTAVDHSYRGESPPLIFPTMIGNAPGVAFEIRR